MPTPSTAPVTLSMTSVTSQARSIRASASWVASIPMEYAASSGQPERHQHPRRPPAGAGEHQQDPGRDEDHHVEQPLAAREDPEAVGRRAADVPRAGGQPALGRDDAGRAVRRDQGDRRRSPRATRRSPAIASADSQPSRRRSASASRPQTSPETRDEQQHHPHAADRKHVAEATDRRGQGASPSSRLRRAAAAGSRPRDPRPRGSGR